MPWRGGGEGQASKDTPARVSCGYEMGRGVPCVYGKILAPSGWRQLWAMPLVRYGEESLGWGGESLARAECQTQDFIEGASTSQDVLQDIGWDEQICLGNTFQKS